MSDLSKALEEYYLAFSKKAKEEAGEEGTDLMEYVFLPLLSGSDLSDPEDRNAVVRIVAESAEGDVEKRFFEHAASFIEKYLKRDMFETLLEKYGEYLNVYLGGLAAGAEEFSEERFESLPGYAAVRLWKNEGARIPSSDKKSSKREAIFLRWKR